MSVTQPEGRIAYAERELDRLRSDVEDWKQDHTDLEDDCWIWEDLIAKINFQFGRILDLESDFQRRIVAGEIAYDRDVDHKITGLYQGWVEIGSELTSQISRLRAAYGAVEGAEDFLPRFEEAQAILASRAIEQNVPPANDLARLANGNPHPDRYGF
jgi:hypothetical protein